MKDIVKFIDGEIEVNAKVRGETLWVTQKQMCELFGRDKSVISRHINNVFKSGELDKDATVAKNATVQKEGKREVLREVEYYNLDVIISVGYSNYCSNSRQIDLFKV